VKHLLSVAGGTGFDGAGETEITGRFKLAYQTARGKAHRPRAEPLFQKALQTASGPHPTSIAGARLRRECALELAEKIFAAI